MKIVLFNRVCYGIVALLALLWVYSYWSYDYAKFNVRTMPWETAETASPGKPYVVMLMDYRCGYCHQSYPLIKEFARDNPSIKVIYQPYPVAGRPSVQDAKFVLAAGLQGKFHDAHEMILDKRMRGEEDLDIGALAEELNVDALQLIRDMKDTAVTEHLLGTLDAVKVLGINATPTWLIGDYVFKGVPDRDFLEEVVLEAYGPK